MSDKDDQNARADLIVCASDAVAMMAPLAAARNVDLAFEVEIGSAPVRIDAPALYAIPINLIDNAIRYNKIGGSVIVISAVRYGSLNGHSSTNSRPFARQALLSGAKFAHVERTSKSFSEGSPYQREFVLCRFQKGITGMAPMFMEPISGDVVGNITEMKFSF